MKVVLLNDSFPPVIDGVANVVMNYANIMQTRGLADVLVGTPKYPNANYSDYPYRVVPYQSIDTTKVVSGYRAGNPFDISELNVMAEFAPDVIHSHCPVSSTVMARLLRHRVSAPLIFTYHTKFDVDIARALKAKLIQKEAIHALVSNVKACDEVWVVSHGAGENLKSLGYEGEYRVVNNGVDFAKGRVSAEKVAEITAGYDLPEGVPVFLFVGRMMKYKGLPLILDALAKCKEAGMDFRMVFVGKGPDVEEMKQTVLEYGIGLYDGKNCVSEGSGGKCIFTGAIYDREALRAWNTRADLFLFPSTYDTNGIVVREAAACGLASVLIQDSCAAEGITHDRNGFVIEETPEAMAALLRNAGKDLAHLYDVGQHAMDEIYISWEESVHEAYRRYGEVIENKKAGMYPGKRQILEEQFRTHSIELYEASKRMVTMPKQAFGDMLDNVESFIDETKEGIKQDLLDGIREAFKD